MAEAGIGGFLEGYLQGQNLQMQKAQAAAQKIAQADLQKYHAQEIGVQQEQAASLDKYRAEQTADREKTEADRVAQNHDKNAIARSGQLISSILKQSALSEKEQNDYMKILGPGAATLEQMNYMIQQAIALAHAAGPANPYAGQPAIAGVPPPGAATPPPSTVSPITPGAPPQTAVQRLMQGMGGSNQGLPQNGMTLDPQHPYQMLPPIKSTPRIDPNSPLGKNMALQEQHRRESEARAKLITVETSLYEATKNAQSAFNELKAKELKQKIPLELTEAQDKHLRSLLQSDFLMAEIEARKVSTAAVRQSIAFKDSTNGYDHDLKKANALIADQKAHGTYKPSNDPLLNVRRGILDSQRHWLSEQNKNRESLIVMKATVKAGRPTQGTDTAKLAAAQAAYDYANGGAIPVMEETIKNMDAIGDSYNQQLADIYVQTTSTKSAINDNGGIDKKATEAMQKAAQDKKDHADKVKRHNAQKHDTPKAQTLPGWGGAKGKLPPGMSDFGRD